MVRQRKRTHIKHTIIKINQNIHMYYQIRTCFKLWLWTRCNGKVSVVCFTELSTNNGPQKRMRQNKFWYLNCCRGSVSSIVSMAKINLPGADIDMCRAILTGMFGFVFTWQYSSLYMLTFVTTIHNSLSVNS